MVKVRLSGLGLGLGLGLELEVIVTVRVQGQELCLGVRVRVAVGVCVSVRMSVIVQENWMRINEKKSHYLLTKEFKELFYFYLVYNFLPNVQLICTLVSNGHGS